MDALARKRHPVACVGIRDGRCCVLGIGALVVMNSVSVVLRSPAAIAGYTSLPNSILTVLSLLSSIKMSAFSLADFAARSVASAPAFAFAVTAANMGRCVHRTTCPSS